MVHGSHTGVVKISEQICASKLVNISGWPELVNICPNFEWDAAFYIKTRPEFAARMLRRRV